jgi:hypothetical protein
MRYLAKSQVTNDDVSTESGYQEDIRSASCYTSFQKMKEQNYKLVNLREAQ